MSNNLPELHTRISIVQEARAHFKMESLKLSEKYKVTLNRSITTYGRIISSLWEQADENMKDGFQMEVETLLKDCTNQYNLTFGEKTQIIAEIIEDNAKYVIRWERHASLDKVGDLK